MTPGQIWLLVKYGGLALAVAGFIALVADRNHLASLNDRHGRCLAAVAGKPNASPVELVCDAPLPAVVRVAAQAASCDAALAANPDAGTPVTCSAPVQRVAAQRDARAAEVADRDHQLADATRQQAAAVTRAEGRVRTSMTRDSHAHAVIQAAPRDPGGDLVFDAGRLRDLSGSAAAAAAGP